MDYQSHAIFLQVAFLILALAITVTGRGWVAALGALAVIVNGYTIWTLL